VVGTALTRAPRLFFPVFPLKRLVESLDFRNAGQVPVSRCPGEYQPLSTLLHYDERTGTGAANLARPLVKIHLKNSK